MRFYWILSFDVNYNVQLSETLLKDLDIIQNYSNLKYLWDGVNRISPKSWIIFIFPFFFAVNFYEIFKFWYPRLKLSVKIISACAGNKSLHISFHVSVTVVVQIFSSEVIPIFKSKI